MDTWVGYRALLRAVLIVGVIRSFVHLTTGRTDAAQRAQSLGRGRARGVSVSLGVIFSRLSAERRGQRIAPYPTRDTKTTRVY